ncbi:relaxase/mobilization nuclease RlxS [Novosphingobium sp. PS1R-30]|uniref:Relaxase/mobilization nuclease RlxS n=1 Tax=Novosphingobium anseongense TaxID=3133436 RepID=A0ABU8S2L8_9SPHN
MARDDDFLPVLGRQRARGKGTARPVLGAILAATNLAQGGVFSRGRRSFTGSRIGRGSGMGQALGARDRFASLRSRRVIIKARVVHLKGKGFAAAKAHLRYVQRDGTSRSGERSELYGPDSDHADRDAFLNRSEGNRHQFRFIVSPEDGAEYEDLKPLTRRLMARMEQDLGTKLDWVAVDHFNTAHPHVHIIVRGEDESGQNLVIAKSYLSHGMRERAAELVDLDLGPRTDAAIARGLMAEVEQERLTSIDRRLLRETDGMGLVSPAHGDPFQQTTRTARLRYLEGLGLAESKGSHWRLSPALAETLKRLGEEGDIIRTMQRAYTVRGEEPPGARSWAKYDPSLPEAQALVGRVIERGLADELEDRHYLVVAATDGRAHYVDIGKGENFEALATDCIVRIEPKSGEVRAVDRVVVEVAAANEGRYSADLHLEHDPTASGSFVDTHVRRLEAIRRRLGSLEREPDGAWVIGPEHLATAAAYEAQRLRDNPVSVETLSPAPLEKLVGAEAATWLDRQLVGELQVTRADVGFGRELGDALKRRDRWLAQEGLVADQAGQRRYAPDVIAQLRRRELLRVAGQLSAELGLRFTESGPGERIEGVYRRHVDLMNGRYALIEKSREFTLVPWRPVLEREVGKSVSGIMRESGINWTIGRSREGPSIS